MSVYSIRFSGDQCRTCQSSDGPVRFYYSHFPTHGMEEHDHVYVSCPHHGLFPLPNDGRWTIESVHPLTVSPSIDFGPCGCHGFIRGGKWVSATSTPNARTACIDAALDGAE